MSEFKRKLAPLGPIVTKLQAVGRVLTVFVDDTLHSSVSS